MDTREKIWIYIKKLGKARASDIQSEFDLSRVMIHRHLLRLIDDGLLVKQGKPPLVFYSNKIDSEPEVTSLINEKQRLFLEKNYLYVSPSGEILTGLNGFRAWVNRTKQDRFLDKLIEEYIKSRRDIDKYKNKQGLIDATKKVSDTFSECFLDKVFYSDFYSIPKFGKTILGQKILYSKQAQIKRLISEVAVEVKPNIQKIIEQFKVDCVAFVPPTVARNVQFLKEFEKKINLPLPKLVLKKAYPGELPIAQKTLSKLEDRIENARNTIFIQSQEINYSNILIIDDAVGSGSTLNETARKIKKVSPKTKVYGYSIVGSFKGFDVINEI